MFVSLNDMYFVTVKKALNMFLETWHNFKEWICLWENNINLLVTAQSPSGWKVNGVSMEIRIIQQLAKEGHGP